MKHEKYCDTFRISLSKIKKISLWLKVLLLCSQLNLNVIGVKLFEEYNIGTPSFGYTKVSLTCIKIIQYILIKLCYLQLRHVYWIVVISLHSKIT